MPGREVDMTTRTWIVAAAAVGLAVMLGASCVTTDSGSGGDGAGWVTIASGLQSGGNAKEVSVNRAISQVRFRVAQGPVTINTFWVRDGAARRQITVGRTFQSGEQAIINIGPRQNVTGLRIGDGGGRPGRGNYNVDVR